MVSEIYIKNFEGGYFGMVEYYVTIGNIKEKSEMVTKSIMWLITAKSII